MVFWLLIAVVIARLQPYSARHRAAPSVPPWGEWTPAELARWEDHEWGSALKRMARRMTPTYQAFA